MKKTHTLPDSPYIRSWVYMCSGGMDAPQRMSTAGDDGGGGLMAAAAAVINSVTSAAAAGLPTKASPLWLC
jgi:hypothetical protein